MPVEPADWQSTLPQAQAAELAKDPSDAEQVGAREHMLLDNVQDWNCAQSALPQAQAAELTADPSDTVHGACLLHRFSACLQNRPVESADSQSALPHAQAPELAADPSDTAQVGILRHSFLLK